MTTSPKNPSLKEIVIVALVTVGAISALTIASLWLSVSAHALMCLLVLAFISTAPLISLYFDHKNPHVSDQGKNPYYMKVALFGAVIALAFVALYGLVPSALSLFMIAAIAVIVIIFIPPLLSLYLDYRNPHASSQARKFSLRKTVAIIIANLVTISVLAVAAFMSIYIQLYNNPFVPNRAEELSKPIDKSLIQSGAVKICEETGNGTAIGRNEPYYYASYQLDVGKDQAVEIVKKAALDNGYDIKQGDSDSDASTVFSDLAKPSTFTDLREGNIEVRFWLHTNTDKESSSCEKDGKRVYLEGNATHTAVSFSAKLPLRKDH